MLWCRVVRHVYTIFLHAWSKKMRDSCAFVIQCYKFPLYFIVVWNKGPLGLKKQQIHTNDVDVSKSCTHVRFFDTHDFFFIRNCMWFLAHLICIFRLMYMWAVLYIKLQGGKLLVNRPFHLIYTLFLYAWNLQKILPVCLQLNLIPFPLVFSIFVYQKISPIISSFGAKVFTQ